MKPLETGSLITLFMLTALFIADAVAWIIARMIEALDGPSANSNITRLTIYQIIMRFLAFLAIGFAVAAFMTYTHHNFS